MMQINCFINAFNLQLILTLCLAWNRACLEQSSKNMFAFIMFWHEQWILFRYFVMSNNVVDDWFWCLDSAERYLIPSCHRFSSNISSCGYHFHHKYKLKLYTRGDILILNKFYWLFSQTWNDIFTMLLEKNDVI